MTDPSPTPARLATPSGDLVTVIVPALNEERSIKECLEGILAQDYEHLQVVVVDGASADRTGAIVAEIASRDPRVEMVENVGRTIPSSLNTALAAAKGRWLVRVDAHSTIPPTYVSTAVRRLREGRWGGVGGRKNGVGSTAAGRAIAAAMASRFGVGNSAYHYGTQEQEVDHIPFGCYPADLVRRLGGWDERLRANEDYEFDYRLRRAGNTLLFAPALVIDWQTRQSIGGLFRQYFRYGRGKADVAALHPRSLKPRHLLPPAFVAYAGGAGLVAVRRPRLAALLLAPYAVGLGAASVITARQLETPAERARVPLAFAAMHVGWGLGFLSGLRNGVSLRRQPQDPTA